MKLREQFLYTDNESGRTFSVKKVSNTYKADYLVCLFTFVKTRECKCTQKTCHSRREAKEELIRLLRLYTSMRMSEILKLK